MSLIDIRKWRDILTLAAVLHATGAAATGDVVVVVGVDSAIGKLDASQVAQLFLGTIHQLPSGGPVTPLDQYDGQTRNTFAKTYLNKDAPQVRAYWARMEFTGKGFPPREVSDNEAVKRSVSRDSSAIGYIDGDSVDSSVKVVCAVN